MEKKKENIIFLLIFVGIISIFCVFYAAAYGLSKQRTASELENRPLAVIALPTVEGITNGDYMKNLDNAFSDQTLLRQEMVLARTYLTRAMANFAYLPFNDNAIPIDYESSPLLWKEKNILIPQAEQLNKALFDVIDIRLKEYAEVAQALPQININIYSIEERGGSVVHPTASLIKNPAFNAYEDYFLQRLTPNVAYKALKLDTEEKFVDYYYKTDHHLNAKGVYQMYSDSYDMLAKNNSQMGEKLACDGEADVGLPEFRGSLARTAAYTEITDKITQPMLKMPNLKTYINGVEGVRSSYDDPTLQTPHGLFIDWYIWYFGEDKGLITYENQNPPSEKNLLIIGSSFTQSMEEYLASHYNTTYSVDLRHYGVDMGEEFNMVDFASKYNIDDVIIITTPGGCYLNADIWGLTPKGRVAE